MKVKIVFDFNTDERKAIAHHYGEKIATHRDMKVWIQTVVNCTLEDLSYDYNKAQEEEHENTRCLGR